MCEAEVWLCVDSCGDYTCGKSIEEAIERYEDEIQPLAQSGGYRVVALKVKVPLPEEITLACEAPALGRACLAIA